MHTFGGQHEAIKRVEALFMQFIHMMVFFIFMINQV